MILFSVIQAVCKSGVILNMRQDIRRLHGEKPCSIRGAYRAEQCDADTILLPTGLENE